MGGVVPTAAMSALQIGMNAAQSKSAADEANASAEAQVDQIRQAQAVQSRDRAEQLKRALATQRARFGAQGLAAGGGSADAALAGLEAESQRQEDDSQAQAALRIGNIEDQAAYQQRRNLLSASSFAYRTGLSSFQRGIRSVPLLEGD